MGGPSAHVVARLVATVHSLIASLSPVERGGVAYFRPEKIGDQ